MNYLQLCQTLRQEVGATGNGPASVVSQTGESLRFVNWIQRAYLKVQTSQMNWRWMHATSTLALTLSQQNYAKTDLVASRFGRWDPRNWVVYETAEGVTDATKLVRLEYDDFEQRFIHKSVSDGRPKWYAIGPDDSIYIAPAPDATGYTLRFRYWKSADTLSGNTDEPEIPADYHWIIVYEAMKYHARREAAPELMEDAIRNYDEEEARLMRDQLDPIEFSDETLA